MGSCAGLIVAAFIIAFPLHVAAQPTFSKNYQKFNINGLTSSEIWESIHKNGPRSNLGIGVGHAGFTSFRFDNSVKFAPANNRCSIIEIKFHLTSIVELPAWTDQKRASRSVQIYWKALASDVRRHEDGHVEIAEQSIEKLYGDLQKIKPQRTCDSLKQKIQATIKLSEVARNRAQNAFERKEMRGQRKRLNNLIRKFQSQ